MEVIVLTEGIEVFVYKLDKIIDYLEKLTSPKSAWRLLIDKIFWLIVISLTLLTIIFSIWIITDPEERRPRYRYESRDHIWQGKNTL